MIRGQNVKHGNAAGSKLLTCAEKSDAEVSLTKMKGFHQPQQS